MTETQSSGGPDPASFLLHRQERREDLSWADFYRLYHKLVYGVARRSGLSQSEAEQVVQDVFKRVSDKIDDFESDPARGTFRSWLTKLTRQRVAESHADQTRELGHPQGTAEDKGGAPRLVQNEELADEETEAEWRDTLVSTALERLSRRVSPKHYQVFDLHVRQHWPILRVSRDLGVNPIIVFFVSRRLTGELREEVARLQKHLS